MPVTFSSHVSNLISELLEKDPNKRLGGGGTGGASAVKGHPFFCVSPFLIYVTIQ
jgi:hypothetical protein